MNHRKEFTERGPKELRALGSSFYRLLDALEVVHQKLILNDRLSMLGKLSLSIAHELRNPLSGIKMNMRVLRDHFGRGDDPGVQAILRETDRISLFLDE